METAYTAARLTVKRDAFYDESPLIEIYKVSFIKNLPLVPKLEVCHSIMHTKKEVNQNNEIRFPFFDSGDDNKNIKKWIIRKYLSLSLNPERQQGGFKETNRRSFTHSQSHPPLK